MKHGDVSDTLRECEEMNSESKGPLNKLTRLSKNIEKQLRRGNEEVDSVEVENAVVRNLSKKISKENGESRQIISRVERRERMICDYVDIVRESETLTRQQYTRAIYVVTLCKEMTKASLSALEAGVSMLHDVRCEKCRYGPSNDNMADTTEPQSGIDAACIDVLKIVRNLRSDVDEMDLLVKVMKDARFLDETLQVSN